MVYTGYNAINFKRRLLLLVAVRVAVWLVGCSNGELVNMVNRLSITLFWLALVLFLYPYTSITVFHNHTKKLFIET